MTTTQGATALGQQRSASQSTRSGSDGAVRNGFIVDFFAPSARLVVEVDGAHHLLQRGADKRRDRALAAAGLSVVRLPAQLVLRNRKLAAQLVSRALQR